MSKNSHRSTTNPVIIFADIFGKTIVMARFLVMSRSKPSLRRVNLKKIAPFDRHHIVSGRALTLS